MDDEVTPVTWDTIMNVVKAIDNNELLRNFLVFLNRYKVCDTLNYYQIIIDCSYGQLNEDSKMVS